MPLTPEHAIEKRIYHLVSGGLAAWRDEQMAAHGAASGPDGMRRQPLRHSVPFEKKSP
jgi:hypothetical protein